MKYILLFLLLTSFINCKDSETKTVSDAPVEAMLSYPGYEAISLLGDTLYSKEPSEKIIERYNEKKAAFEKNPDNIENIIWFGRFTAYKGDYREAITIYTRGIEKYPKEPRLYRHRGHRYISIREFEKATVDLTRAAALVEGKENQVEEDGMPNAQNIPVSTLHGNIYYHLGLAYYLQHEMEASLKAYKKCLETSNNPDNVVSATHWIYMIYNRLGRPDAAKNYLRNIKPNMNVIENTAYYRACLFYKGELELNEINKESTDDAPSDSALKYALGNWLYYTGQKPQAEIILRQIVAQDDWASFGHIAAESDLAKLY